MFKQTKAEALAAMIATRSTELHLVFDRAAAMHLQTQLQIGRLKDMLTGYERTMTQCRGRAAEQGYPDLL